MPRKIHKIGKFEGGINDHSDPRDIKDDQLVLATDCNLSTVGQIINVGSAANATEFGVGGTIFFGAIPSEGPPYERYIGILAVTATTTTTAGTVNAGLTFDPSSSSTNKAFADATN